MPNTFGMCCPKCNATNEIDIEAKVWVRLTSNGTDADASKVGDHTWTEESPACCAACGHSGTVREFDPEQAASLGAVMQLLPTACPTVSVNEAITQQLRRLIALCDERGTRIDHLIQEAWQR